MRDRSLGPPLPLPQIGETLLIAILGGAPSSCNLAPFGDPNWEIWACSPGNWASPRVDAWFEMHSLARKNVRGNEPYINVLRTHPRVYLSAPDKLIPNAIVYPKDDILPHFGGQYVESFMQSSVSYMLAMAITLKPKVIGLWGVDMAAESEYDYQRPGCHFFFNEALKRGIDITAPPQSDIMNPLPLYGYKEHSPMYWRQKARKQELMERVREADHKMREAELTKATLNGALSDINYINNTYLR